MKKIIALISSSILLLSFSINALAGGLPNLIAYVENTAYIQQIIAPDLPDSIGTAVLMNNENVDMYVFGQTLFETDTNTLEPNRITLVLPSNMNNEDKIKAITVFIFATQNGSVSLMKLRGTRKEMLDEYQKIIVGVFKHDSMSLRGITYTGQEGKNNALQITASNAE